MIKSLYRSGWKENKRASNAPLLFSLHKSNKKKSLLAWSSIDGKRLSKLNNNEQFSYVSLPIGHLFLLISNQNNHLSSTTILCSPLSLSRMWIVKRTQRKEGCLISDAINPSIKSNCNFLLSELFFSSLLTRPLKKSRTNERIESFLVDQIKRSYIHTLALLRRSCAAIWSRKTNDDVLLFPLLIRCAKKKKKKISLEWMSNVQFL